MPVEAIIILIVVILTFLAFGIWAIIQYKKGPEIPEGHKFEHEFAGNKAIVVFDPEIVFLEVDNKITYAVVDGEKFSCQEVAERCAVAIGATEAAFKEKGIEKANINLCIFQFQTDESFEKGDARAPNWWSSFSKKAAAYSTTTNTKFGSGYHMAIIRSKYIKTVFERGQPACHELVHILNKKAGDGYQHKHDDPDLWNSFGSDVVEARAVRNWNDIIKSLK